MNEQTRSYVAEFVGTFTLVFIGTAVAAISQLENLGDAVPLRIAFAFGFTLMVLVWTIGPVSGCHVNPAVTIPMALSGRLPMARLPGYLIAQFAGGVVASCLLLYLLQGIPGYDAVKHHVGSNGNPTGMSILSLFFWELILTALFLLVIFSLTRPNLPPGPTGLGIGGFLFVAHLVGVPLGDSSLNPARSLGPAIFDGGDALKLVWLFIVAPIVGGVLGLVLYRILYDDEPADEPSSR